MTDNRSAADLLHPWGPTTPPPLDLSAYIAERLAREAARDMGQLISFHIIPVPMEDLLAERVAYLHPRNYPRRVRRWLARRRYDYAGRLSLAWAALRGRHECDW